MNEVWRDIKEYEGLYQISSYGRVKSLRDNHGNYREKIRDLKPNKDGYIRTTLSKNSKKKTFTIHRLVAQAFIPNPNNYKEVNHKDEDKTNNCVENLEWCTSKYNNNYGTRKERVLQTFKEKSVSKGKNNPMYGKISSNRRKVLCITTNKSFNSIKEAGEYYNIKSYKNISKACRGKLKSAGKHPVTGEKLIWKYID